MNTIKISIARIVYPVKVLGPGMRIGVWMTGCHRRCPGCISPQLQKYDASREITVDSALQMILSIKDPVDGVTISGGEPFDQASALRALTEGLREITDDILIYTGYTLQELRTGGDPDIEKVLHNCSALIDGVYIRQLDDNKGIRGSSNQCLWVFRNENRYTGLMKGQRQVQTLVYEGRILTIGIPEGDVK